MPSPASHTLVCSYLTLMGRASKALAHSLDNASTLAEVARLFVPAIADACTIDLLHGERLERCAVAHINPQKESYLGPLGASPPSDPWHEAVLLSGEPLLQPELDDTAWLCTAQNNQHLRELRQLRPASTMVLPLHASDRVLGLVTFYCSDSGRRFTDDHLGLASELVNRVAVCLDNAELSDQLRTVRAELERAQTKALKTARYAAILAAASKSLTSSLDQLVILRSLMHILVGDLGDLATAELLQPDGMIFQAAEHADQPAQLTVLHRMRSHQGGPHMPTLGYIAAESGQVQVLDLRASEAPPLMRHLANSRPFNVLLQSGVHTLLAVPLCSHERSLGAISIGLTDPERQFTLEDISLLEELAHRTVAAIDNARAFVECQRAVAVRDEFLSIASHELRTPLTALELQLGHMGRLLEKNPADCGQLASRFAGKLGRACRQAGRLAKLVDNLLDVTRISAGRLCLERSDMDLGVLVRDIADRWQEEAQRAGCVLETDIGTDLAGFWDCLRLEQVLSNLLSNALRYGAGHPVHVSAQAREGLVFIAVRDSGIGIAPEAVGRIFERFERAASCRAFGGLGLGLFIARQIVEAHGGRIDVDSYPGGGAVFNVVLPQSSSGKPVVVLDPSACNAQYNQSEDPYEQSCSVEAVRRHDFDGGAPRF